MGELRFEISSSSKKVNKYILNKILVGIIIREEQKEMDLKERALYKK